MLQNKKILLGALTALLTIVFFTYQIIAQSTVDGNRRNPSDWNSSNVPQKYWLNEDQIAKVNDIRDRYDEKIQPQIDELYNLRNEAYEYKNGYNTDYKKVREYRNQISQLEQQIYDMRLEGRNEIGNILVSGQRPYYRNFAFNNWWSWDMDNWCNWDMDRYMMDDMYYEGGMSGMGRCCW